MCKKFLPRSQTLAECRVNDKVVILCLTGPLSFLFLAPRNLGRALCTSSSLSEKENFHFRFSVPCNSGKQVFPSLVFAVSQGLNLNKVTLWGLSSRQARAVIGKAAQAHPAWGDRWQSLARLPPE